MLSVQQKDPLTPFKGNIPVSAGISLLNIFPNPCYGETSFYTDDPEAAHIYIFQADGNQVLNLPIQAGVTVNITLILEPGTYQAYIADKSGQWLGKGHELYML